MIGPRPQGVTLAATQLAPRNEGPAHTLINIVDCELIGIAYYDEYGARRQVTAVKMGDRISIPQGSEQWTQGLRSAPAWLQKAVQAKLASRQPSPPPSEDSVDVIDDAS